MRFEQIAQGMVAEGQFAPWSQFIFERLISRLKAFVPAGYRETMNDVSLEYFADVAEGRPNMVALEEFVIDDHSKSRLIKISHCLSATRNNWLL